MRFHQFLLIHTDMEDEISLDIFLFGQALFFQILDFKLIIPKHYSISGYLNYISFFQKDPETQVIPEVEFLNNR